jgi:AraC-like DNA-binding protein
MDSSIVLGRPGRVPEWQAASRPAATPAGTTRDPNTPGAWARGSLLRPLVALSTAGLPAAAQFGAWCEQCGPAVEMVEALGPEPGYPASCTSWKFGPFALSAVRAPAARYRRTRQQIRRDALDHWVITVTRRGTHGMRTEAGTSTAPTALPCVFSFADAFEGQRSDIDWLCLFLPRETFPELGRLIDRCRQLPLDSGMGRLLACYLDSLDARLPGMTEAELPRLVAATRAMVAACVVPSAETREAAAIQLGWAQRERVRQAIRQKLCSPRLTPNRLCLTVGMSRSQLYRLFESSGGVARYIQTERLREAHRALSDPDARRDIREIAGDLGFFDASTFSRAFRREFGCTPIDVRMAALVGERSDPVRRLATPPERPDAPLNLAAMLRML